MWYDIHIRIYTYTYSDILVLWQQVLHCHQDPSPCWLRNGDSSVGVPGFHCADHFYCPQASKQNFSHHALVLLPYDSFMICWTVLWGGAGGMFCFAFFILAEKCLLVFYLCGLLCLPLKETQRRRRKPRKKASGILSHTQELTDIHLPQLAQPCFFILRHTF